MENNSKNQKPKTKESESNFLQRSKFKLAIGILFFYLLFIAFLTFYIDIDEKYWGRFLFLFSGVEAIVFAAIGYVFGRDVSRNLEKNAEKKEKEANKEKEKAIKEKEKAEKKAVLNKENLIRIQEAVISENQNSFNNLGNESIGTFTTKSVTKSEIASPKTINRSLELATNSFKVLGAYVEVSFKYTIKADDFKSISIDGNTKYDTNGYYSAVFAYGNTIDIEVDRDNFKIWEFEATDIIDEDGRKMKMSNSPLKSNGNKTSFKIEY